MRWIVLVAVVSAGCFGAPPEPGPPDAPQQLQDGSGSWEPVGDFSWQTWEQSDDGQSWTMTRVHDAASMDILQAFVDGDVGALQIARGDVVQRMDAAQLQSWNVEAGETLLETVVFSSRT